MYRFLLSPRWLGGHLFMVCAVVFCTFMGSWQLSRFEARVDSHRAAQDTPATAARDAVPLERLLPRATSAITTETAGRTVRATGRYDSAHQFLVPGRELDGRTGYYVLTPLRTGDGAAVLPVVRGWLPGDADRATAAGVPAAPAGEVTVTGALQAPEGADTDGAIGRGGLPEGQLGIISAASLVNLVPYQVYGAWITQTEGVHAPLRAVPPVAPSGTGLDLKAFQNLGYTGEWFVFAGFVVFMWFRLVRREAETRRDAELGLTGEQGPAAASAAEVAPDEVQLQS
ncbi:SURF1 family protein [Actinacidiphila glaucinigra]|uniref:SURF1 family protein n=1 Tax=Actinacidiphila glaucinigra TaxID=235986 RepID=UPI0036BB7B94